MLQKKNYAQMIERIRFNQIIPSNDLVCTICKKDIRPW